MFGPVLLEVRAGGNPLLHELPLPLKGDSCVAFAN